MVATSAGEVLTAYTAPCRCDWITFCKRYVAAESPSPNLSLRLKWPHWRRGVFPNWGTDLSANWRITSFTRAGTPRRLVWPSRGLGPAMRGRERSTSRKKGICENLYSLVAGQTVDQIVSFVQRVAA